MPLADKIRPNNINEVVGQTHIIGEHKLLNKILQSSFLPNMIFFGPPGVGKTTVAEIVAKQSQKTFYKINITKIFTKQSYYTKKQPYFQDCFCFIKKYFII